MEAIVFLVMLVVALKPILEESKKQKKSVPKATRYEMPKQAERVGTVKERLQQKYMQLQREIGEELWKSESSVSSAQMPSGQRNEKNTTILQRAKTNVAENKEDVTLHTMEEEHNHSERVAPAVHDHPEDVLSESMLGSVEDLMVKGYDGNLCFERDFVGEGLDMISRFTI